MNFSTFKTAFWRVPLISLLAGFLYTPCYTQIVLHFGVTGSGTIRRGVSLLASGLLMAAVLILGGIALLRNQTRMAVLFSAVLVSGYGLVLYGVQLLFGMTTGPAATVFLYLNLPFRWAQFPAELGLYLQEQQKLTLPFLGVLPLFVPCIFALFGKRSPARHLRS